MTYHRLAHRVRGMKADDVKRLKELGKSNKRQAQADRRRSGARGAGAEKETAKGKPGACRVDAERSGCFKT